MGQLRIPVTEKDYIQGLTTAPITLVEYGDYQCPYCGMAYPQIKRLQQRLGEQLRFVFRNFPIAQAHPWAEAAAEVAEFAGAHGKFWEMHDRIYEEQRRLDLNLLLELSRELGFSDEEFEKVLREGTYREKVKADFLGGVRSGVSATPTFFINDEKFNGSAADLENAIRASLV